MQHVIPRVLLRPWPFPHGSGRLTDLFFSGLSFSDEIVTIRTTDGFSMSVMPNELIGRHLYLTGEFDRSTAEALMRFARPGDVLLDVGANIGYVSACFLHSVPQSRAIAVEPQPKLVSLLRANLAQFDDRGEVICAAISDSDGKGWMEVDNENFGAGRLASESDRSVSVDIWSTKRLFSSQKK